MHEGGMLGLNPGLREHGAHLPMLPGFGLNLGHAGGGGIGPLPPPTSTPNMWPFIWNHITK